MSDGAKGGTRTPKGLAPLAPKTSASTNSATFALIRSNTAVHYLSIRHCQKAFGSLPTQIKGWPAEPNRLILLVGHAGFEPATH